LGKITEGFIMTQLKELEKLINEIDDKESFIKALKEIHQVLCWLYEWLQKIEEAISKES